MGGPPNVVACAGTDGSPGSVLLSTKTRRWYVVPEASSVVSAVVAVDWVSSTSTFQGSPPSVEYSIR